MHADRLRVRLRPKRASRDTLAFMRQICLSYPAFLRIYWIQDNLSANWTPRHPDLRGRQQDGARPDPDLRQLPEPGRVPLHTDQPVRRRQRRLPRLGTPSRSRATSPTATAITASVASPPPKPGTASPPDPCHFESNKTSRPTSTASPRRAGLPSVYGDEHPDDRGRRGADSQRARTGRRDPSTRCSRGSWGDLDAPRARRGGRSGQTKVLAAFAFSPRPLRSSGQPETRVCG